MRLAVNRLRALLDVHFCRKTDGFRWVVIAISRVAGNGDSVNLPSSGAVLARLNDQVLGRLGGIGRRLAQTRF